MGTRVSLHATTWHCPCNNLDSLKTPEDAPSVIPPRRLKTPQDMGLYSFFVALGLCRPGEVACTCAFAGPLEHPPRTLLKDLQSLLPKVAWAHLVTAQTG